MKQEMGCKMGKGCKSDVVNCSEGESELNVELPSRLN